MAAALSPREREGEYFRSVSRGEKVAEERSKGPHVLQVVGMRGLVNQKIFAKVTSFYEPAIRVSPPALELDDRPGVICRGRMTKRGVPTRA